MKNAEEFSWEMLERLGRKLMSELVSLLRQTETPSWKAADGATWDADLF